MQVLTIQLPIEPQVRAQSGRIRFGARERATLWLTLAFWISNFAISTLASILAHSEILAAVTVLRVGLILAGLVLCSLFYAVLRHMSAQSFRRRAIAAAIMAPLMAEAYAWLAYFGSIAVDPDFQSGSWSATVNYIASWTWFFLAWAGLALAIDYSFEARAEQERSAELQALAHAAKLQALQNQVNPHFFFNTLNSMSALLLDRRIADAEGMITKLAGFFRMTLAADPLADTSLADELTLQKAYLEIEQVRFPDLEVRIDVPEALRDACVPSLILQPLVENAVKHGVGQSSPPCAIEIRAQTSSGVLTIAVENRCGPRRAGARPSGTGLGLHNVAERLTHRFGHEARLTAETLPPNAYRVTLEMPLVRP